MFNIRNIRVIATKNICYYKRYLYKIYLSKV